MAERWEPKERKSFPFVLDEKDGVDVEERRIKGYFAVMGNFDGYDIIEKGAFKKTLEERGDRVKVFYIHDFHEPIGKPVEVKEVPRGRLPAKVLERAPEATAALWADLQISETRRGNETLRLAKDGVMDEGSIGFDSTKDELVEHEELGGKKVRHIKELRLYDLSPVPIGMNPGAIITEVKSAEDEKIEVTDDFIHIPAPGEAGKHDGDDHRKRTIPIDKDKGIQAGYCGSCKKIFKYIFEKAKTWTVAKAKAWIKEHHEKSVHFVGCILEAEEELKFRAALQRADFLKTMLVDVQEQPEPN